RFRRPRTHHVVNQVTPVLISAHDDPVVKAAPQSPPAGKDISQPVSDRPAGSDGGWGRTVGAIRGLVASLQQTGEAAGGELKEKRAKAAAWISSLVERLVEAAGVEIDATARRARADADIDLAQVHALVSHLQAESDAQRREIARLQQQLDA